MTSIRVLTLGVVVAVAGLTAADDKKDEKKPDADMLVGTWKVTGGKKAGAAIGDDAKRGTYVFTKDTIKIMEGDKALFVIKYTLDAKKSPAEIDMEITEAPVAEAKGSKAKGIVEVKGDDFKIAYFHMGDERPKKFDDEKAFSFELKKQKEEKKKEK
jgi:uncharacterized protein (TIGR03067 family)